MKRLLILIPFLLVSFFLKAQIVPSICTAPDSIVKQYQEDAKRLALRKIIRQNLPEIDSSIIPATHVDTVMRALLAVHNATSLAAADTVRGVHTFPTPSMRFLTIGADSTLPWMQQLRQMHIPTGDAQVDSLLSEFGFSYSFYYALHSVPYHTVELKTDSCYNAAGIGKKFESLAGVYFTETNYWAGDGNDILDSVYVDHVELIYSIGWEDCPAGCAFRRYWKFNVYFDCSVEFVGSYGNALPTSISPLEKASITVYPNPFSDYVQIDGFERDFQYTLCNSFGQEILSGQSNNGKIENLKNLPTGLYLIRIKLRKEVLTFKINRQQ